MQGRECFGVRHDEGHNGHCERAAGALLGARDGQTRDMRTVRGEHDVVRRDEENCV